MNRSQLRNVIESGRSVALDCYAIGGTITDNDPVGRLFENDILNKSVILKRYESAGADATGNMTVSTLVYFPYDFENVYDGGESINLNDRYFVTSLAQKLAQGEGSQELIERINKDMPVLKLFESMHSLDPFLLRSKSEQLDMEDRFHERYLAITQDEWEKIRGPIREKINKLVTRALGSLDKSGDSRVREAHVERFLMKIWLAKDVDGIESFIKAMQIAPEMAPSVFFAWKAVCYYQVRFNELIGDLKKVFQWVGGDETCFPIDSMRLLPEELRKIRMRRGVLRKKMRNGFIAANAVLKEYDQSYDTFVDEDKPQKFIEFLGNAENSYLSLAAHVSVATHAVNLWNMYVNQHGSKLRYEQFIELFEGMNMLYGVEDIVEQKAWATS
ncbi:MAG: hypothetical protein WD767_12475 [Alphaproteobacteria bacterium]